MEEIIRVENLTHTYGEGTPFCRSAVQDMSLDIYRGEFLGIIGHTGSGKSTLAKLFNALYVPGSGTVWVCGMDTKDDDLVFDIRQHAGMVFQNPDNQIVATVVEEDVAFGLENNGVPPEPNKFANAVTISKIGNVTPTPVSASTDVSEICPIYMRSTVLYKTFTNCASTIGTARRRIVLEIGPFEKSSFFFISAAILLPFRIKK